MPLPLLIILPSSSRAYFFNRAQTVVITIWLTFAKYPYLKWHTMVFSHLSRFIFSLSRTRILPALSIWLTWWVSYTKQHELLIFREYIGSPKYYDGVHVAQLFGFLWVFLPFINLFSMLPVSLVYPFLIAIRFFYRVLYSIMKNNQTSYRIYPV